MLADTLRFVVLTQGIPAGSQLIVRESPTIERISYEYNDPGGRAVVPSGRHRARGGWNAVRGPRRMEPHDSAGIRVRRRFVGGGPGFRERPPIPRACHEARSALERPRGVRPCSAVRRAEREA